MRKTYNAPEMTVVEIQTAGMIATSMNLNSSEQVSGNRALSREGGFSFWDDEEED